MIPPRIIVVLSMIAIMVCTDIYEHHQARKQNVKQKRNKNAIIGDTDVDSNQQSETDTGHNGAGSVTSEERIKNNIDSPGDGSGGEHDTASESANTSASVIDNE